MYIVTHKNKVLGLRNLFIFEKCSDEKIYAATNGKCIESRTRYEVIKEFNRLVGHPWNRRSKEVTMHRFDDYLRAVEDVTDTRAWQERKIARAEAKRIAAKVRKSRLY